MKGFLIAVAVLVAGGVGYFYVARMKPEVQIYILPRELTPDEEKLVANNNKFAWKLFQKISKECEGNLAVAPFSVSNAFAMTYAGAKDATAEEMERVFHFEGGNEKLHSSFSGLKEMHETNHLPPGTLWNSANRLWIHKNLPLEQPFQDLLEQHYDMGFEQVDFAADSEAASKRINEWVSDQTAGKIERILQSEDLDAETRLVLANAIYFKSEWEQKFEKSNTQEGDFHVTPTKTVLTQFMNAKTKKNGAQFRYWNDKKMEVLELPYKKERFSMIIFLPKQIDGLEAMVEDISAENVEKIISELSNEDVKIILPRLKISSRLLLNDTLNEMGLKTLFSPVRANLSGLTKEPIFLSQILHQTIIEVNEEGSEIVAVTAVQFKSVKKQGGPIEFRADHPFLFLIRDKHTGSILFMGRVVDPSQTE